VIRPRVNVNEVRKAMYQLDMMRGRDNVSQEAYERWEDELVKACKELAAADDKRRYRDLLARVDRALDRLHEAATS
jgi:hypothetical protein